MCVVMVIIYKKTLDKKRVDDVTTTRANIGQFQAQTMSQGAALFSCGLMDRSRWHDVAHSCAMRQNCVGTSLDSLWDVLPGVHTSSVHWDWDVSAASGTLTSLLQDLRLTEAAASPPTAPPSKRQCRSMSCSGELGACRSAWRPQGSRVWTTVEKRRCHSGGSVQRSSAAVFPAMQRSSSFSLPAFSQAVEPSPASEHSPHGPTPAASMPLCSESSLRPLYLSHEQISIPELRGPSPASSPDSTPELDRRSGQGQSGLARSHSQPCVLNEKKIGVKRRRPDDTHKTRPSLDLAKMTQKLHSFHSLSCPGFTDEEICESDQVPPPAHSIPLGDRTDQSGHNHATNHVQPEDEQLHGEELSDLTGGELDWNFDSNVPGVSSGKDNQALWAGLCSMRRDVYQLGGELDIEQIERN